MICEWIAFIVQQGQVIPPVQIYNENVSILRQMSEALRMSFYRVLSMFVAVLPGILACFVALVLFTLVGMVFSACLRWVLGLVRFDDRIAQVGAGADWTP